ncbi:MAG: hypothetical protein CMH57_15180 [Myxococcales bacterium]|nr:hypothetical protein [Myxococcales bacterium]
MIETTMTHRSGRLLQAALMLLVCGAMACSGSQTKPDSPWGDLAPPPNAQAALAEVAPWLPEDTVAVAFVDVPFIVDLYRNSGLVPKDWDDTALRKDLGDFSRKRLGVDVTKARWAAVAFSAPTPSGEEFVALFLEGDFKAPSTLEERDFGGLKAYRVGEEDFGLIKTDKPNLVMYVFEKEPMERVSSVRRGDIKSLATSPTRGVMEQMLATAGSNRFVVVGQIPPGLAAMAEMEVGMKIPQAGAIGLGEKTNIVLQGDPASLETIRNFIIEQRKEIQGMLAAQMQGLDDMDLMEGSLLIMGYHLLEPVGEAMTPQIKGDVMTLDLGPEGLAVLSLAMSGAAFFLAQMPMMMMEEPMAPAVLEPAPAPVQVPAPEPAPAPKQIAPNDGAAPK